MFSNVVGITDTTVIEAPDQTRVDSLYWWLTLAAVIALISFTWTGYISNSFHSDDTHTIVENTSIRPDYPLGRIFTSTRATSSRPEYAAYRPLTTLTYALDTRFNGTADPVVFQLDSVFWFFFGVVSIYGMVRMIPGAGPFLAMLAAAICAVHPLASQALNYTAQRHLLLRTLGVALGIAVFAAWPRQMPQTVWFPLRRIPQHKFDIMLRRVRAVVNTGWVALLRLNIPLYLFPVLLGLLADPGTAIFPLVLLAWIKLFEPERGVRSVIPSAVLCGSWWLVHTAITWTAGAPIRPSAFAWWFTQPWVAVRTLGHFFYPRNLPPDSALEVFTGFSTLAVAGIGGLAVIIFLGLFTARHEGSKTISFGIWWFLIALLPEFLIPQPAVEVFARAYMPAVGLSIAIAGAAWMVVTWFWQREQLRWVGVGLVSGIAFICLALLAFHTHGRNYIWQSGDYLWSDVLEQQPSNPRALLNYGRIQMANGNTEAGFQYLEQARVAQPGNTEIELELALSAEAAGKTDAGQHFQRALTLGPTSALVAARYSEWLLLKQQLPEAEKQAERAVALDPDGIPGRKSQIAILIAERRWKELEQFSTRTINLAPGAPDGPRGLTVARAALDEISDAEKVAKADPVPENYLRLSSVYMQNGRFEDGINACRAALKIQPELAEAWSNISVGYHMMGKLDDSIAALREAVRIRPDLAGLRDNLEAELQAKAQQGEASAPAPK